MNFVLERTVEPDGEPMTLAEMKRHLRMYDQITAEDDDITALITAAREWVEDFTGRALMEQTWQMNLGDNVSIDTVSQSLCGQFTRAKNGIYLRRSPVLSIESFVSVDGEGEETDIDEDTYRLVDATSKWPRIVGVNGLLSTTGEYRVTFKAGFVEDIVPKRFIQAMKLWAEANYDRDKDTMDLLITQAENMMRLERCHLQIA